MWIADNDESLYGPDEPYRSIGSAGTLTVTRPEGEEAPKNNPIGFVWNEHGGAEE